MVPISLFTMYLKLGLMVVCCSTNSEITLEINPCLWSHSGKESVPLHDSPWEALQKSSCAIGVEVIGQTTDQG